VKSKAVAKWGVRFARLGVVAVAALCGLGFLARWNYLGELAVHLTAFYFGAALIFAPIFLARRKWRWLAVSGLLAIVNGDQVIPYYFNRDSPPLDGVKFTALTSNVLILNTRYQDVVDYVQSMRPDILALEEVSETWLTGLAPLRDEYPYRVERPLFDNHGIALYSRIPLEDTLVTELADSGISEIEATVHIGNKTVRVYCIHTVPPRTQAYALARNRMFVALAERVNQWNGPCVVLGDFNNTLWSPHYRQLERDGKLRNARQGFGILSTWPANLAPLMVPLDHILHSADIAVTRCEVGADIGSDHRPLFAELVIPN